MEDNGWPNIEARLAYGFGENQEYMGGRKQRPLEFGVSGVVGQIEVTSSNNGTLNQIETSTMCLAQDATCSGPLQIDWA